MQSLAKRAARLPRARAAPPSHVLAPLAAKRPRARAPPPPPRDVHSRCCAGRASPEARTPYVSKHFRLAANEVQHLLSAHGLRYRATRDHAIVETCPFCPPTRGVPDNQFKLYVLRASGAYMCHRCRASGSWYDLRRGLGRDPSAALASPSAAAKPAPHAHAHELHEPHGLHAHVEADPAAQPRYEQNLWTDRRFEPVRRYLRDTRGLTESVLRAYGVGATTQRLAPPDARSAWEDGLCATFPLHDGEGRVVRHKVRPIAQKAGMRLLPRGGSWGLFGLPVAGGDEDDDDDDAGVKKKKKSVVLTEGEYDAMAVFQATGRPAVSVPNGAAALPVAVLPLLERFDAIVLWMDADEAGQAAVHQFARKLGLHRCVSVGAPHNNAPRCKDANDVLRARHDMHAVLSNACVVPHEGVLRFDDLRVKVFDHLSGMTAWSGVQSASLPRLNALLKGHRRGELTIVSGHTGVGKTTLLSQLSLDYCMQGVPTMWGSFEIEPHKLAATMLSQFHRALGGGDDRDELTENFDHWATRFSRLPLLFMRYHGSNSIEPIVDAMDYGNYVHDCAHVVLDNLQFMTYGQGGSGGGGGAAHRLDRFDVMDDAVSKLRDFATRANVHVSLVVHPRKELDGERIQLASIFGSAKATQEADNVMIVQRTAECPVLEVKKNRFDGSLGSIKLNFDRRSRLFSPLDSPGAMMRMTVSTEPEEGWESSEEKQPIGTLEGAQPSSRSQALSVNETKGVVHPSSGNATAPRSGSETGAADVPEGKKKRKAKAGKKGSASFDELPVHPVVSGLGWDAAPVTPAGTADRMDKGTLGKNVEEDRGSKEVQAALKEAKTTASEDVDSTENDGDEDAWLDEDNSQFDEGEHVEETHVFVRPTHGRQRKER